MARLAGPAEACKILGGISRQRLDQLRQHADFPAPLNENPLAGGDVWLEADIQQYARETGRGQDVES